MNREHRLKRIASIVNSVNWGGVRDPLGNRVDLSQPLMRMALDRRLPNEERYFSSGIGNYICNDGTLGETTLLAVRVINRLLDERLCEKPDILYEPLSLLSFGWTEDEMTDPLTGEVVVLWEAAFRELYKNKDMYIRDFHRGVPTESRSVMQVLWLLAPKYPEILDELKYKLRLVSGSEKKFLEAEIDVIVESIQEDLVDHDYRYDIDPW